MGGAHVDAADPPEYDTSPWPTIISVKETLEPYAG